MKATVDGKKLAAALDSLAGIAGRKVIDIHTQALLEASDGAFVARVTNGEQYARVSVEAAVERQGRCIVDRERLASIVSGLDGAEVSFSATPGGLHVRADGSSFRLGTGNPDEFPEPEEHAGLTVEVNAALAVMALKAAMEFVATAGQGGHQVLQGVHLRGSGDAAFVESSDGKRVFQVRLPLAAPAEPFAAVISKEYAKTLIQALKGHNDPVRLRFSERAAACEVGDNRYLGQLLQWSYVNVDAAFKRVHENSLSGEINAGAFTRALERAVLILTKIRAVTLTFAAGKLTVSSQDEAGEAQIEVPCVWEHPEYRASYNGRYLLDYLGLVGEAATVEIVVGASDETLKPICLYAGSRYLLAAMR